MSGIESGEKDSDTVGRFNEDYSVSAFLGDVPVAIDPITGVFTVVNGGAAASTVYVECSVNVSEPLVGLPTAEMNKNESNCLSINNLELLLQWNDMRNVFIYLVLTCGSLMQGILKID